MGNVGTGEKIMRIFSISLMFVSAIACAHSPEHYAGQTTAGFHAECDRAGREVTSYEVASLEGENSLLLSCDDQRGAIAKNGVIQAVASMETLYDILHDHKCRNEYGAAFGEAEYVQCRTALLADLRDRQRLQAQQKAAERQALAAAFLIPYQQGRQQRALEQQQLMDYANDMRPVRCISTRVGQTSYITCR